MTTEQLALGELPHRRYDGPVYQPDRDNPRLDNQRERILTLMQDGQWRTLAEISGATGGQPEASVSAQLRHLRKPRFGSWFVEKELVPGSSGGLYRYRLLDPNDPRAKAAADPELDLAAQLRALAASAERKGWMEAFEWLKHRIPVV